MVRSALPAALILAVTAAALWIRYSGQWGADMSALYFAGYLWGTGRPDLIYATPHDLFGYTNLEDWQTILAEADVGNEVLFPYLYPPVWAAVLAPAATTLEPIQFFDMSLVVLIASAMASLLFASFVATGSMLNLRALTLGAAVLLGTQPAILVFDVIQPQVLVIALCLASLAAIRSGRSIASGVLLGLAAALKLSPLFLALLFVVNRDLRAVLAFVISGGTLAAASFVVAGWDLNIEFVQRVTLLEDQLVLTTINYAIAPLLHQITASGTVSGGTELLPKPDWISWSCRIALVCGLVASSWRLLRCNPDMRPLLGGIIIVVVTSLTGPLGWAHHYILPMLLAPGLVSLIPEREAPVWLIIMFLVHSVPYLPWLADVMSRLPLDFLLPTLFWMALLLRLLAGGVHRNQPDPTGPPSAQAIKDPAPS